MENVNGREEHRRFKQRANTWRQGIRRNLFRLNKCCVPFFRSY